MEKRIYLDNNATTQIAPEVKEVIEEAIDLFGNPSSHGKHGQIARKKVEEKGFLEQDNFEILKQVIEDPRFNFAYKKPPTRY